MIALLKNVKSNIKEVVRNITEIKVTDYYILIYTDKMLISYNIEEWLLIKVVKKEG